MTLDAIIINCPQKSISTNLPRDMKLSNRQIQWCFNLEWVRWWGELFERLIGSLKRCLRKVLGNAPVSFHELVTVMSEEEATSNSRSLTYEYDIPGREVLTPAHLMYRRRRTTLPRSQEVEKDISCRKRNRHVNKPTHVQTYVNLRWGISLINQPLFAHCFLN